MSAHKHTPGPWTAEQTIYGSIVCKDGKSMIAVWPEEIGGPAFPHEANARLIAAAPELLAALKNLRDAEWMVTHEWGGDRKAALDAADAAIAKATGEQA